MTSNEDFDPLLAMSFHELRSKCRKMRVSAKGTSEILRERLREVLEGVPPPFKKARTKSPADDLVCPITLQLPWEPVYAEDGRIYEKNCIEEHISFSRRRGKVLKSPYTNEPMGERLFPAPQIKNLIDTLVENEGITGELADQWKEQQQLKKYAEEYFRDANKGDKYSMYALAMHYYYGERGFKLDWKEAFSWAEKAHSHGHTASTVLLAEMYGSGKGVIKDKKKAMLLNSISADQGSRNGAYHLGRSLAKKHYPKNNEFAIYWLEKCISSKPGLLDDLKESEKNDAVLLLTILKSD